MYFTDWWWCILPIDDDVFYYILPIDNDVFYYILLIDDDVSPARTSMGSRSSVK